MRSLGSVLQDLLTVRDLFSTHVYRGPIQETSKQIGLHSLLRSAETNAVSRLPGPNVTISAGQTSCTFYNDSLAEYRWFSKYPEAEGGMPVLERILDDLNPDDNFWDVGGNIGIYSCFAGAVIENGSISVFEPHPKNAERIRTNLERNGRDGSVYEVALASERDELTFYPVSFDVAGAFGSALYEHGDEPMRVDGVRGDELVARGSVPPPNVIKLDVEGAEYDALSGLEQTLSRRDCRVVYCDVCSEWSDVEDAAVYRSLEKHGFDVERFWEWPDGKGHYVRAES